MKVNKNIDINDPYVDVYNYPDGTIIVRWIKEPFSSKFKAIIYCFQKLCESDVR
jgi:hypothetical protein